MSSVQGGFCAGAAKVDITPPLGTVINGDFVAHYADNIHDPLFAKALVLEHNSIHLVFVVVDICVMGKEFIDGVKISMEADLGIDPRNVMVSSTHTHAAGSVEEVHLVNVDQAYRNKLPGLIMQAVALAKTNLQPAQVAFGSIHVPDHVRCRRYYMRAGYQPLNPVSGSMDQIKTNPFGVDKQIVKPVSAVDPELGFMAIKDLEGQWISILANYSLHYVGDWDNGTISADYFGFFSEILGEKLNAGEDFVGIMSNGTSGDVNIWDFLDADAYPKGKFEKSRLIGGDLAAKIVAVLPDLVWEREPVLVAIYHELSIKRRMPQPEELEKAKEIIKEGGYEQLVPDLEGWKKIYAREQVLLNEFEPMAICPLQLFRVGKGIIGGLPGEFFAQTGLALKNAMAPKHYFTIGLANGNVGYVPPREELERGGYETWRCRISSLEPGAEERIRLRLVKLMGELG